MTFGLCQFDNGGQPASRSLNRKALCIGINRYSSNPLDACVNDARGWKQYFDSQGFSTQLLLDNQATRQNILNSISSLVSSARAGDVIAIQYSGHGTQLSRTSGDESTDEALVPIDYQGGNYVVDDDLGAINDTIRPGVNVSYFMDCCHSGSNTRSLFGVDLSDTLPGVKVRYLPADEASQRLHFRSRGTRGFVRASPYEGRREVLFAACEPLQLSLESGGSGHFTRRALQVLNQGISGVTNEEFVRRVRINFPHLDRQRPALWSDDSLYAKQLLGQDPNVVVGGGDVGGGGGGGGGVGGGGVGGGGGGNLPGGSQDQTLLALLQKLKAEIESRGL